MNSSPSFFKRQLLWQLGILRRVKNYNIDEDHLFFGLTLFVGVGSGLIAVALSWSVDYITHLIGTDLKFTWWSFGLGFVLVAIAGLITQKFPFVSGSGIPAVKLSIVALHGTIRLRDGLAKFFASILTLSSGFSLGREGPTVTVCAAMGSSLGRFFSLTKKRVKTLVAIGATGGIAAAFNTPIAAVIFTLEEIVGDLNSKILGPVVISSVLAAVVATSFQGNHPSFTVLTYQLSNSYELFFYLFVGLSAAIWGPFWVNTVVQMRGGLRRTFKTKMLPAIFSGFILVALASLIDPRVLGSGHHVITEVLTESLEDWRWAMVLFFLKFLLTSYCYSTGMSGGLFMPTLFMGAMLGASVGSGANFLFPGLHLDIGAFALVGMSAFFAAVIRAPFTSIIMIFEMTHDVNFILPLMIASITAYVVSGRFGSGSIYEKIAAQDGIRLPAKEDDDVLESLLVEDAMVDKVVGLAADLSLASAIKQVNHSEISGYPVLTQKGELFGIISLYEIGKKYVESQGRLKVGEACSLNVVTVYPDQSLLIAFHKLKQFKISRLIVVSRLNQRKILGVLTAEDIVKHFGHHLQQESTADLLDKLLEEKDLENR